MQLIQVLHQYILCQLQTICATTKFLIFRNDSCAIDRMYLRNGIEINETMYIKYHR